MCKTQHMFRAECSGMNVRLPLNLSSATQEDSGLTPFREYRLLCLSAEILAGKVEGKEISKSKIKESCLEPRRASSTSQKNNGNSE